MEDVASIYVRRGWGRRHSNNYRTQEVFLLRKERSSEIDSLTVSFSGVSKKLLTRHKFLGQHRDE